MTKAKTSRCSAILPPSFILGRPERQCRKKSITTMETHIGYTIHHPWCGDQVCGQWILQGKSVRPA